MWLQLVLLSLPFSSGEVLVHPQCVGALVSGPTEDLPSSVALRECNTTQTGVEVKGAQVTWSGPDAREFTRYEVAGKLPNGDWVLRWEWSGGGSGSFSGAGVFRLSATALRRVRTFAEGDRCNGGLGSVSVEGAKVKFGVSATPLDVLRASKFGKSLALDAGLLETSAMSCVATLEFTEGRLTGATLDTALEDRAEWTEKYRLQHCYNALQSELAAKKPHLDLAGLEDFARQFKARCVAPP